MAITTFDQYLGAHKQYIQISKTASVTTVAGQPATTFTAAGFPGAGSTPGNTTTGVVPTSATTGFPTIDAPAGSNKLYLSRVEAYSSVAATLAIYDVLFWAGPTTIPTSGTTTVSLSTRPSFATRLPFLADGTTRDYRQTELWAWASTAWSNHAHTLAITYTDQAGNTGASTGNVSTQNRAINRLMRMPWAADDYGTRDLEEYAVNGIASASGAVVVMVMRRLWQGRVGNYAMQYGPDMTGMPELFSTSALMLVVTPDSTSTGTPQVVLEIAQG
jgi:hypothetical protein